MLKPSVAIGIFTALAVMGAGCSPVRPDLPVSTEDSGTVNVELPSPEPPLVGSPIQANRHQFVGSLPTGDIVIYSKNISYQDTRDRSWPSTAVLIKVNDQIPELLATVGDVNEYPADFVITDDKKYLLINLESKLQALDLATGELKNLVIAKEQIAFIAFSPDKTQIFIWDQKYYNGNGQYYVRIYDFTTRTDKVVGEGRHKSSFFQGSWRDDGKVLIGLAGGEYTEAWYYDLNTGEFTQTLGRSEYGPMSDDGKRMAVVNSSIDDICNGFWGGAYSTYRIIEPITGHVYDTVGDPTKASNILAFSPDNKQVLYSTQPTAETLERCGDEQPVLYFISDFAAKSITPTTNYQTVLAKWKERGNWVVERGTNDDAKFPTVLGVSLNGKVLAHFDHEPIEIIAAYQAE